MCAQQKQKGENELDDDITVEKKSLIILTAAYDEDHGAKYLYLEFRTSRNPESWLVLFSTGLLLPWRLWPTSLARRGVPNH